MTVVKLFDVANFHRNERIIIARKRSDFLKHLTLLLHFQRHTDKRYKDCLLKTMIYRAYALSPTNEAFNQESTRLRSIFTRLDYPITMINTTINKFIRNISSGENDARVEDNSILRMKLSPLRIKRQLTQWEDKCVISVTRSALLCNRCLLARNWNKTSCQKKSSLQSSINNVLCILFHVICAMQIMSAIQPDTSTSALWNTRTQRLENISWKPMGTQASSKKANFAFSESVKGNLIASSTRCFLSKNAIPAWTHKLTPFVRNYLLETRSPTLRFYWFYLVFVYFPIAFILTW